MWTPLSSYKMFDLWLQVLQHLMFFVIQSCWLEICDLICKYFFLGTSLVITAKSVPSTRLMLMSSSHLVPSVFVTPQNLNTCRQSPQLEFPTWISVDMMVQDDDITSPCDRMVSVCFNSNKIKVFVIKCSL